MDHIEIRRVNYEYTANERAVTALRDVSFGVAESEFICVLRRIGCGKTTLLNILAGFLVPTKGDVLIGGRAVSGRGLDRGVVFQDFAQLFPWRTAQRNVEFGLEMKGVPRDERAKTAQRFLGLVNLESFAGAYPHELSGGMQQRAAIARALVHDPKLVLMDEPFGALDALTREKMNLELLRIWKEAGKTILFVTHGISEAVFLGSRVVVFTAGPARMADDFRIDLPHPRTLDMKTHEAFGVYTRRIYKLLGME